MHMKGISLTFVKQIAGAKDAMNNPTYTTQDITVADCLVAPIREPMSDKEQQAMNQSLDQIRIHIPKTYTGDVGGSSVEWGGKTFQVDSDSIVFMNENTPTRWNRYFRGECVNG